METSTETGTETKAETRNPSPRKRWPHLVLGLAVSAVFVVLCLRRIELARVGEEIARVALPVLALSLLSKGAAFLSMAWRTRLMFQPPASVSFGRALRSVILAFSVNNVAPFRMGELVRVDDLARASGLSRTGCLAVVAFERLLDAFTLALVVGLVLPLSAIEFPGRQGLLLYALIPALGLGAAWWTSRRSVVPLVRRLFALFGERVAGFVSRRVEDLERGWTGLGSPRRIAGVTLASFGYWLAGLVSIRIWMEAFGLDLPWYAPVVVQAYLAFGVAIPSSPSFVGTYHFFCIAALERLGVETAVATSFAIVGHFMAIVPYTVASAPFLLASYLRPKR